MKIICDLCGDEIEYCGITSGEEYDEHIKEKHEK